MDRLAEPLLDDKPPASGWRRGAAVSLLAAGVFASGVVVGRFTTSPAPRDFVKETTTLAASEKLVPTLAATEKLIPQSNKCVNGYTTPKPEGPKKFDCPAFVMKSTDDTWHRRDWAKTSWAVDTYFTENWQSLRAFGITVQNRAALKTFMGEWLGAFPDVFIRAADVFCDGNDVAGYKTTMPYVLTATHTGWSKTWGEPTGQKLQFHGIANCFVQKNASGVWQYTNEWDTADVSAYITVLNRSIASHPPVDTVPVDECKPLFDWKTGKMNWRPPGVWAGGL